MMNFKSKLLALHDANMQALSEAIRAAGGDPTVVLYSDTLPLMHILAQNNIRLTAVYEKPAN
jgi:hypothetical protein